MSRWESLVVVGDSFAEGVGDPLPDGTVRGWSDLTAIELATRAPGFRYANLAVRGRRLDQIVAEQIPAATGMRPDLICFSAGGNDALRPGFDVNDLMARFDRAVGTLTEAGAEVVLFRFPDQSVRLPLPGLLRPRIIAMNDAVSGLAGRHGAHVVDLFGDAAFGLPDLWCQDRLHLSPSGHRRVADQILATLGVAPVPESVRAGTVARRRRRDDARWAQSHLGPWLRRRLTGGSSGDGVGAKRPRLSPVTRHSLPQ
ncbi:SGNH/GDSL hydrolase family protein [Streptomyces sp. RKAG293]|uniref:SGNH/GDSL hydrolase family protein n=1 Tax=Streptomyces sp. RKAG293 TaxID=2893403 RepID=UPI0020338969|nr:SGNH/GDSL hydrolase family protein [Streptomyces sp. RKAG293]MCM2422886.1 SGNH/GDSL hydrolase family protein [Streptomyces sp. RKAG293]